MLTFHIMALTRSTRRILRYVAAVVAGSAVAGGVFALIQDPGNPAIALTIGVCVGTLMSCTLSTFELVLVPVVLGRGLSRIRFTTALLIWNDVSMVVEWVAVSSSGVV